MFIISGGGSGIGRALAHALSARNQRVHIIGRTQATLDETAGYSPLISQVCADITSVEGRLHILDSLQSDESIKGLVHNAGIIDPIMRLDEMPALLWEKVLATNVSAPLYLTQALQSKLHQGRVLHIGSGAAYFPVAGWGAYCVSKAALSMLASCLQLESHDIDYGRVMPGIIDTDMQAHIRQSHGMNNEKLDFFKKLYDEKRLLTPETVARFLVWLLLDVSKLDYVSKEWDIYDKSHHPEWLINPYTVPEWEIAS